jgi:hypothetical protein
MGTSSIDWAQLSRLYLKAETRSSLRNVVLTQKNKTMDNALLVGFILLVLLRKPYMHSSPLCSTFPALPTLLHLIILIIFREAYKSRRSSLGS